MHFAYLLLIALAQSVHASPRHGCCRTSVPQSEVATTTSSAVTTSSASAIPSATNTPANSSGPTSGSGLTIAVVNNCQYPVTVEVNGFTPSTSALAVGETVANLGRSSGSGNVYFQAQGSGKLATSNIGIGTLYEWTMTANRLWYDISNVNGYNMPMTVGINHQPNCKVISCSGFVCPKNQNRFNATTSNGIPITYCGTDNKDDQYAVFPMAMKATPSCATTYRWSHDDLNTYTCDGSAFTTTVSLCNA